MVKPRTRTERLYDYFMDREGCWIDTFVLEKIAGRRSWRSRVSDVRKRVRLLRRDIVNRQRRQTRGKQRWTTSEYALVKGTRTRKQAA